MGIISDEQIVFDDEMVGNPVYQGRERPLAAGMSDDEFRKAERHALLKFRDSPFAPLSTLESNEMDVNNPVARAISQEDTGVVYPIKSPYTDRTDARVQGSRNTLIGGTRFADTDGDGYLIRDLNSQPEKVEGTRRDL